jgi:hypothetical protein
MKHALGLAVALAGCLSRPPFSGEETLADACVAPEGLRQVIDVPAKARFDFLWMIDDSGSMGPHQASLAANFRIVARFLHETLAGRADYRFAFTTTDLRSESARGAFRDGPPRLLPACDRDPAACDALRACEDVIVHGSGEPAEPDRWRFGPIIRSGTPEQGGNIGTTQAELEHVFDCAARVGVMGDGFEKGLEAARLALSCDGPNRALFAPCCVDRTAPDGTRGASAYDADCAARLGPGEEPAFLRPNATLVVFSSPTPTTARIRSRTPGRAAGPSAATGRRTATTRTTSPTPSPMRRCVPAGRWRASATNAVYWRRTPATRSCVSSSAATTPTASGTPRR